MLKKCSPLTVSFIQNASRLFKPFIDRILWVVLHVEAISVPLSTFKQINDNNGK